MRTELNKRPFPDNIYVDLNAEPPETQAEDFYASLMYVLRVLTDARNSRAFLLRYKEGKTFDEIGDALGVSKQRAQVMLQNLLDSFTGEHVAMLRHGVKKYYENLMSERIEYLTGTIEDSEREQIKRDAYADGYDNGFADGLIGKPTDSANTELLSTVSIDTVTFSVRAYNALKKNGIKTLGDIVSMGDGIIKLKTFGKTCFIEIAQLLEGYNVNIKATFPKAYARFAE